MWWGDFTPRKLCIRVSFTGCIPLTVYFCFDFKAHADGTGTTQVSTTTPVSDNSAGVFTNQIQPGNWWISMSLHGKYYENTAF